MSESTTLFPTAASIPESGFADAAKARRIPMRPFKIGLGVSLLLAGVYGIVSDRQYISTDNAVVTAYVVEVRTPIDGVVTGLPAAAGVWLQNGAMLGSVENERFDAQRFQSLGLLEQQASEGASAARAEHLALDDQGRELLTRADLHLKAVSSRLRGQRAEAERLLAARTADVDEAQRELERGRQLHSAGILADAEFERLQSKRAVAAAEREAQQVAVATLDSELRAAANGVLSEPGANSDVPYSRQRADEVRMRLAEIDRSWAVLRAQAAGARADRETEAARATTMRHSDLVAPIAGVLWKLDANNGERLTGGEPVARLVDCAHSFVLAEVAQEKVPEIAVGASARIRLSGEAGDRAGTVLSISGDPQRDDNRKLAAFPNQNPHQQLATVRISLDANAVDEAARNVCPVGRAARVLIPVKDGSTLARLWRQYL